MGGVNALSCRDSFDAIYGASAGAINATYFLTGQREGVDIYAEDIANRTFCDLSRLLGPSKSAEPGLTLLVNVSRHSEACRPPHLGPVSHGDSSGIEVSLDARQLLASARGGGSLKLSKLAGVFSIVRSTARVLSDA